MSVNVMRILILILMQLFGIVLFGQKEYSKTSEFLDSLNNLNNPINWGEGYEYIENVDRLSEIAMEEDSFKIYELCRRSIIKKFLDLDDYIGLENALKNSKKFAEDTINSSVRYRSSMFAAETTLFRLIGDFRTVIEFRLKAIELIKEYDDSVRSLATLYGNLATDYMIVGDFMKSKEYSIYGLNLVSDVKEKVYHRILFNVLVGQSSFRESNYQEAYNFFKHSAVIMDTEYYDSFSMKRLKIDNLLWLSETCIKLGNIDEAKLIIDKVKSLQKITRYRVYRTHEVESKYFSEFEQKQKMLGSLKSALSSALKKKKGATEYSVIPRMYLNLSNFYKAENKFLLALDTLQRGLCYYSDSLILDLRYNPLVIKMKYNYTAREIMKAKSELCQLLYMENRSHSNFETAAITFEATLGLYSSVRKSFLSNESKFYVLEKAIPVYNSYLDLVFDHYEKTGDDSDKDLLYDIIGQTKSAILSDKINYKNLINDPNLPPSLIEKEKDLRLKRALYKKQVKKIESQDSIDVYQLAAFKDSLFRFNQDYDILDKRIRETKEEVTGWNLNDDIELDQLSKLMKQDEMIIDYYVSNEYIYYVAILNGETFVDRVFLESVKDDIINFVDYISQPPTVNSRLNVVELSDNIFSSLLKPYIEKRSSVKSLRILPSGLLNTLPFEALSYEEEGVTKYLVEDCSIVYSVSRSQLLQKEELSSSYNIMALAPKFESDIISDTRYACDGAELSNLKYAQEEVGYIQNTYAVSNNDSISASYFLENISNNDICHLATHGCVNASDPMLSEIFFNDQPVTGYDVMNLDTDLSLMFLSACNTARGEDVKGEGVIGLTSGFFEAGVRNMISSLWSIDDLASSQIVKGFYKNVKEGDTYSQALRASKLEYLESADKLRSHPYYWAGLVQIGAGVTVQKSQPWWMYGIVVFISLTLILWYLKYNRVSS